MATVVLCGSARFETQFKEVSKRLGLMGHVVIGLSSYPSENEGNKDWYQPDEKEMLDLVHLEKIRQADVVLIVDGVPTFDIDPSHDPYIGFSTAREILWANMQEKPMFSLLSASGWGNIHELINSRWDEAMRLGHSWIVGHAHHVLRNNAGKEVVAELIEDTSKMMMHAALSLIHCVVPNESSNFSLAVLEALNLDPMDALEVERALTGVVGIPADWCGLRPSDITIEAVSEIVVNAGAIFEEATRSEELKELFSHQDGITRIESIGQSQEMIGFPVKTVQKWRSELLACEASLVERGNKALVRETLAAIVKDMAAA